jgi:hypothetical protein
MKKKIAVLWEYSQRGRIIVEAESKEEAENIVHNMFEDNKEDVFDFMGESEFSSEIDKSQPRQD